jgi:hypothetical protein
MRRWSMPLVLVLLVFFAIGQAGAATGPSNTWTQQDNHNWPASSSSPNCSPCVAWDKVGPHNYGYHEGTWTLAICCGYYVTDAQAAVDDWSGQPYESPYFSQDSGSCTGDELCVTAASLPAGTCGTGPFTYNSNHIIYHAVTNLNTNIGYYDGPAPGGGCDARDVYRHELGHNWSEGHSAVRTDLMYTANNNVEVIDSDAQAELRAVYGPLSSGSPNGGGGCSGSAQTDSSPSVCASSLGAALKAKLAQLVHSIEGPVTMQQAFPSVPS